MLSYGGNGAHSTDPADTTCPKCIKTLRTLYSDKASDQASKKWLQWLVDMGSSYEIEEYRSTCRWVPFTDNQYKLLKMKGIRVFLPYGAYRLTDRLREQPAICKHGRTPNRCFIHSF